MTDTKPTIDEQIAHQRECAESAHRLFKPKECALHFEKLASLERLKQIESAEMPVEPDWVARCKKTKGLGFRGDYKEIEYIDELLAVIQRKEFELSAAVHMNDEQAQRVFRAEAEASELQKRFEIEVDAFYKERERAESAERERDALRKDAERYRWLRDNRLSANINFTMAMNWKPELLSCDQIDAAIDGCIIASSIDAAIDNAMNEGSGK
jgi:hypothetical protein